MEKRNKKDKMGDTKCRGPILSRKDELFRDFLEDEKLSGRMEKGLIQLKKAVPKLFHWLEESELQFHEVGVKEALAFQGWIIETGRLDGQPYQSSTVRNYLKAAGSFYEFLKSEGMVFDNPFRQIRKIREEKILPRNILKEEQMETLLTALSHYYDEKGSKNQITMYKVHVIAELMYSSGLRISEVADLQISDIDFMKGIIHVREGKGGIARVAWLNDYAKDILHYYVTEMRELIFSSWNEKYEYLLFGTPWDTLEKLVNRTLKEVSERLKLGHFTSHGFRHALGYHLLRSGCNIRYIQEILGHKSLKNTEVYTKVDREDLKEVLDNFHPRKFSKV